VTVYAQVWKGGTTDAPGQGAGITAELRYTTDIAAQQTAVMAYNTDVGNNDEYYGDVPQAALVGAAWVDVTVVFTDVTDNTTFEVLGDQSNNPPPLRYNVVNVTPNAIDVKFTLCMSGTATSGAPCVIGSQTPIGNWGTGVTMNNVSGDLWDVTVNFPAGSNPYFEYKYKKDGCTDWEFVGNRSYSLPTDGTTSVVLAADSWNNSPIGCGLGAVLAEDKVLCLRVCMSGVTYGTPLCVTGSIAQLGNWATDVTLGNIGPDLFQACVAVPAGTPVPLNVEYKFKKDACGTWEGTANRVVVVDNSLSPTTTLLSTWEDGPGICDTVGLDSAPWSSVKSLFR
jgi:hypothetical protein